MGFVLLGQGTASMFNDLGLPEFEAIEAFVRYDPVSPAAIFKPRAGAAQRATS